MKHTGLIWQVPDRLGPRFYNIEIWNKKCAGWNTTQVRGEHAQLLYSHGRQLDFTLTGQLKHFKHTEEWAGAFVSLHTTYLSAKSILFFGTIETVMRDDAAGKIQLITTPLPLEEYGDQAPV